MDYSEADLVQNLSEEIPNTIIFKYETVEIQNGSPAMQIKADKAEVYDSKEETHLSQVDFYNYEDGEINNHGRSNSAVLYMKSGDAQLTGSIKIESTEDNSSLRAESIYWIDEKKILSSDPEDTVLVRDKEGSELTGQGFSADIKRKTITFDSKIKGVFISNEKE
ncbi:MAG: LPS export ABC transporter periplasmic protein LptC [Spirochaetaceae bacterium]|nr:LPS export ABC transporter periplasmic protein LptC [Spirochaetaceae bacterium]